MNVFMFGKSCKILTNFDGEGKNQKNKLKISLFKNKNIVYSI